MASTTPTPLTADRFNLVDFSTPTWRLQQGAVSPTDTYPWGAVLMVGNDDGLTKNLTGSTTSNVNAHAVGFCTSRTNANIQNPANYVTYGSGIGNLYNSATDPVTSKMQGQLIFAADNQTACATSGGGQNVLLGRLERVDPVLGAIVLVDGTLYTSGSAS